MINFNRSPTRNYAFVQQQILGLIQAELPPHSFRESVHEHVGGCLNFTLFINKSAEVLMSHGAADKSYLWKAGADGVPLNHGRERRHLFVPGPFLVERVVESPVLNFGADQVHSVGWPRLDWLLQLQQRHVRETGNGRRRVLWAPSHDYAKHGNDLETLSSYPGFKPYVERLRERCEVSVSLHPRNRKDKKPTDELLVTSDVVISDHGTLVYEAWALGKRVIFPDWLIGERLRRHLPESAEWHIFQRRIGDHAESFEQMCEMIDSDEPPDAATRSFLDHFLDPRWRGCSARRVAELLQQLDVR